MKLLLPLPPTMNTYWRHVGNKVLVSARGRSYRTKCALIAQAQCQEKHVGREVEVIGTVYMARAGCDLDNRIKPLLDALNGVAYEDDVQVARIELVRAIDRDDPRCEIEVVAACNHDTEAA